MLRTWSPDIDVFSRDGTFVVRMDLPGVRVEDVRIEISDAELIVSAEAPARRFFSLIPLPPQAWSNRMTAAFDGGLLEVRMPVAVDEATELGALVASPVFAHDAA